MITHIRKMYYSFVERPWEKVRLDKASVCLLRSTWVFSLPTCNVAHCIATRGQVLPGISVLVPFVQNKPREA